MTEALDIVVRLGLYATLLPLFGLALSGLYVPVADLEHESHGSWPQRWLAGGAVAALGMSGLGLAVLTAGLMGVGVEAVGVGDVGAVLTGLPVGAAWLARLAGLLLVLGAVWLPLRLTRVSLATIGAGVALASLAWSGHGAMDSGGLGIVHAGADIAHLLAAGAWLGGLLALARLLWRPAADAGQLRLTHRAWAGFAGIGTVAVALLVLSGLVNSWLLIGLDRLPMLWTSLYGRLLLIKLALFVVMLALAAANRFRLTPALGRSLDANGATALRDLRRSVTLETVAAALILGAVAWLGTLAPPISM